jgi:hypothetical protein
MGSFDGLGPSLNRKYGDVMRRFKENKLYHREIEKLERSLVLSAMTLHRGNVKAAAQYLGIARTSLFEKVIKFGIAKQNKQHDVVEPPKKHQYIVRFINKHGRLTNGYTNLDDVSYDDVCVWLAEGIAFIEQLDERSK